MNSARKSGGYHAWCAPISGIRHPREDRSQLTAAGATAASGVPEKAPAVKPGLKDQPCTVPPRT